MTDLSLLGWNADWAERFVRHATQPGLVPGRIGLEHNHIYRVLTADGEWLAEAAGRLKFEATGRDELPAVGDWVGVRRTHAHERALIHVILPRRSRFSRKAAGRGTEEQVVASNIDTVFLVFSLEVPLKPRSIERYLVLARQSQADPVIVLNKADCAENLSSVLSGVAAVAPGVPVHAVSARDGRGFEWIETHLIVGRTVALLGPSGGGKSSIVNRLVGHELLATGGVRSWDARGRHTSVHRHLIVLDRGGIVIDTPGLRELQPWENDEAVNVIFADISALAASCRFRDCRHDTEPGCGVKAGIETGDLDPSRYEAYLKLVRERDAFEVRQDERALIDKKRRSKIAQKALRAMQTKKGRP